VYIWWSSPGASNPTINAGTVRNEGIELAKSLVQYFRPFYMSLGYNVTVLRNNVTYMGAPFIERGSFVLTAPSRMQAGYPIGIFMV
jgi:hypothetical protein